MVLELHVWGPAFSLPSLDPFCLAAIAYLTQAIPKGQWVLIASSDAGWSPTKELPVLRDGEIIIGGFQNIIDYLRHKSNGEWDLDKPHTNPRDRADITAFSSHLTTHLHPLLSLSLYVSTENYTSTTRPSYTPLLPIPTNYLIPPSHRARAALLSQHLHLSTLDLSSTNDEDLRRQKFTSAIPAALRTSRQTVTGLVNKSQTKARFRLDALVDAACEPLQQLLGGKKWFLEGKGMSSLDCLALGYLALAVMPNVPQRWLGEGLRDRYPGLCAFVERGVEVCFGEEVGVEDALISADDPTSVGKEKGRSTLPWKAPAESSISTTSSLLLTSLTSTLPFRPSTTITHPPKPTEPASEFINPTPSFLLPTLITATTAIAAAASYLFYTNFVVEPEKRSLTDMGEAGALLAGMDFGGAGLRREKAPVEVVVEVDSAL